MRLIRPGMAFLIMLSSLLSHSEFTLAQSDLHSGGAGRVEYSNASVAGHDLGNSIERSHEKAQAMDIYKPRRYTEYGDSVTIKWGRDSTVRVEDPGAIDGRGIADLLIRLSPLTNFKGNETFEVVRRESYKRDGVKRHRIEFRQTIHGMPLDQTGKIVVSDDEYVRSISVMAVDDTWLDSDSAALITEEEALQIAINDLKKYGLSEIEQSPSTYFAGYVVASHRKLSPVLIAGFSAKRQGGGTVGYTARVNLNNGEVRSWPSQDEFWPIYIDLTTRFSLAFNAALSEPIVSTSCD